MVVRVSGGPVIMASYENVYGMESYGMPSIHYEMIVYAFHTL